MNSLVSDRNAFSRASHVMHKLVLLPIFVLVLSMHTSQAGNATWNLNPTSGDWNTSANWTPATVPNGPQDIATFGISDTTVLHQRVLNLNGIVFNEGASSFTIAEGVPGVVLTISGEGITNNSGVSQNFVTNSSTSYESSGVSFTNTATAGSRTIFTNNAANTFYPVNTTFYNNATAGSAMFINYGPVIYPYYGPRPFSMIARLQLMALS